MKRAKLAHVDERDHTPSERLRHGAAAALPNRWEPWAQLDLEIALQRHVGLDWQIVRLPLLRGVDRAAGQQVSLDRLAVAREARGRSLIVDAGWCAYRGQTARAAHEHSELARKVGRARERAGARARGSAAQRPS